MLEAGVPLTLLLDLAMPIHSVDTYRTEPGGSQTRPTNVIGPDADG